MNDQPDADGIDFGHEFHGREHHFRVTRAALEYLAGTDALDDETARITAYNAHLQRIHAVAETLSRNTDALERIVLEREAFASPAR